jgi:hypothetical protein
MLDAVFKERISKRLLIEANCKFLPDGNVKAQIELSRYSIDVESRTSFWARRIRNCEEIIQSLQPQSGGDSNLGDLATACSQLAIAGVQMKSNNGASQTLLRSVIDNKVSK